MILGEVNRLLAGFAAKNKLPIQYKMGPDPSSIDSCMVGGVVSNNSSGMCCGVSQNTYHTLKVGDDGCLAQGCAGFGGGWRVEASWNLGGISAGWWLFCAMDLLNPLPGSNKPLLICFESRE